MSEQTIHLGRDGDGNGNGNRAVAYSMPEIVPLAIAIASLLFNNQLPGDVIALILRLAVNGPISQLNAAVVVAVSFNGKIVQLNAAYANYTAFICTSLTLYAMIQVPIFAASFSVRLQTGCQIWWSQIVVSGLASASIIVAIFVIFILQFKLLSRRGKLRRQLRDQVEEGGLSIFSTTVTNGEILAPEREEYDDDLGIQWFAQRVAFLVILTTFSLCFLLSFTQLLCPNVL